MVPQAHQTTSFVAQLVQGSRAAPAPAGPSAEDAAQRAATAAAVQLAFEAETQAALAELQTQAARQQQMVGELECGYAAAEQQQHAVSDALASLAAQLDHVSVSGSSTSQPLLSLGMPNGYAEACSALLESLEGYVQHHFPGNDGNDGQGAAAQHQQDSRELQQLQSFLCKAERLRVEEEAEMARLQAELDILQASSQGTHDSQQGCSTSHLEAEAASLQQRQAAALGAALEAAEVAAAASAGAEVLEEQCRQRQAVMLPRLQAKQQVAAMLARHLARQLVVRQLLQLEQAAVQQVLCTAEAAAEDAHAAAQAAEERLPGYDVPPTQEQGVQAPQRHEAAASTPAALETVQQLLACRTQMQHLSQVVHEHTLPAQQAVVTQLAGLLYCGDSRPQLSTSELQAQLAAAAAAHQALNLQANAVLAEVMERQAAAEERQLGEQVLVHFWTQPEQLAALVEKNQRRLERYA
ncbi:hypothetical protein ACK3TF_000567 [Chlorella vulgaris]